MTSRVAVPDLQGHVEHLAVILAEFAGEESVRVLEALAAALANRLRRGDGEAVVELADMAVDGLAEPESAWHGPPDDRRRLCQRIARRALRGSLLDPTRGATAFHRLDASPAWARRHLPVAVVGQFLFYRI